MDNVQNPKKIVIFSGAGLSQASGLPTFRDSHGLWQQYDVWELASPKGFAKNPELVHQFYQERRLRAHQAQPNEAHVAIAQLELRYDVVVITQNVDDLHERAGSSAVIHLHGKLNELRRTGFPHTTYQVADQLFTPDSRAPDGKPWQPGEWRPNVVWFTEMVPFLDKAARHLAAADTVLVVGTSLDVEPAASLLLHCSPKADKFFVDVRAMHCPADFQLCLGPAVEQIPQLVSHWLRASDSVSGN